MWYLGSVSMFVLLDCTYINESRMHWQTFLKIKIVQKGQAREEYFKTSGGTGFLTELVATHTSCNRFQPYFSIILTNKS